MKRAIKGLLKRLPGLKRLVAERDAARTSLAELQARHVDTERLLADERERAGNLAVQLEEALESRHRAHLQRSRERDRARELVDQLREAREGKRGVKQDLNEVRDRAHKLERQLAAAQARLDAPAAEAAPDAPPPAVAELEAAVASLRKAVAREQGRVDALRKRVRAERAAKQELRQRVIDRGWRPGYARSPWYRESRQKFLDYCRDLGGLRPDGHVLDMGCGIGGMGELIAPHLSEEGSYDGVDVDPRAIEVAAANLEAVHPNVRFQKADVYNSKYNPEGTVLPNEYRFPFEDASFDLTILRSVFTHMLPEELERYLAEVARTLKPGGRALITFFLLNETTLGHLAEREEGTEAFTFEHGFYRLQDDEIPEAAVAYDEPWVRDLYAGYGLEIVEPVVYGNWARLEKDARDQDLVVATKV